MRDALELGDDLERPLTSRVFDGLRGDPEFEAILAEIERRQDSY